MILRFQTRKVHTYDRLQKFVTEKGKQGQEIPPSGLSGLRMSQSADPATWVAARETCTQVMATVIERLRLITDQSAESTDENVPKGNGNAPPRTRELAKYSRQG